MSQSHFCHNNTYVTTMLMSQRHIWHNDTYAVMSSERSHRDGITGCWIGSQDLIASDEDDWAASSSCRLRNTCLDRGFSRVFFDVQKTSVQACVCICARTCARQFLLLLGHNYIGRNYIGHNYIGHNYVGHASGAECSRLHARTRNAKKNAGGRSGRWRRRRGTRLWPRARGTYTVMATYSYGLT